MANHDAPHLLLRDIEAFETGDREASNFVARIKAVAELACQFQAQDQRMNQLQAELSDIKLQLEKSNKQLLRGQWSSLTNQFRDQLNFFQPGEDMQGQDEERIQALFLEVTRLVSTYGTMTVISLFEQENRHLLHTRLCLRKVMLCSVESLLGKQVQDLCCGEDGCGACVQLMAEQASGEDILKVSKVV